MTELSSSVATVAERVAYTQGRASRDILPSSSDPDDWTDAEKVRVEAAGLVFTYPDYHEKRGQRVLAPRPIVEKFMHTVQRTGLDPLARQIYCIPRLGRGGIEWGIQTGIDGFRVVAERSKQYAGRRPFQWMTEKGEWVDVFVKTLHGEHPLAARVEILRHDWDEPLVAVATWDEYAQTTSAGKLTSMWATRGPGQLAKCAEALGLRSTFPQDLSGIYTDDEMGSQVTVDAGELRDASAPSTDERPRGRSRLAQLSQGASSASEGVATPVEPETASERPVASPAVDYVEAESMEACEVCRRATPVTELHEEPRGLCTACAADIAEQDAADAAADARGE